MIDPKDDPGAKTADAEFMCEERALIATLIAGTGAMRAAGEKHLPKAPAESQDAYKYRLAISTLYNGMRRTVDTLAGKPFSEPIKLGETVPKPIVEWCDDVDLQGRDLHAFAHAIFVAALADGLSHVLVEYPPTQEGATLADKKVTGARPYFLHIRHDQILGWRSERIEGVETLTQLRFLEVVTEPAGLFGTARVEQVRVLEPTKWQTFRKNKDGEWAFADGGVVTLGAVPLATVYSDRTAYMQARPPLLDLAYLNVEHWQSSSDQSNILHIARVPILFASGFMDGALKIGAGSAVTNDDPTSKLMYVEHTGAAIEAGRDSLKDLEERMSLMGAQLLVKKPGARTATEKAIDSADADSALSLMARTCEDSLEQALQFMADWEKLGPAGEVELTGEIGGLEDMEIAGLMKARELGLLSAETVFNELQRRGLITDDIEWAEERTRLVAEGPPIAVGGSFEAPNLGGTAASGPVAATASGKLTQLANPDAMPPTAEGTAKGKDASATPGSDPAPAVDHKPLIDALKGHTEATHALASKPAEPIDWAPLAAILQNMPPPVFEVDVQALAGAIAEGLKSMPAQVINLPEQPAHTFNVDARTTVGLPEQPAPIVNVAQPDITVQSPTVNVAPAQVTVEPAQVSVTVEKSGNRTGTMTGPDGKQYSMEVKDK